MAFAMKLHHRIAATLLRPALAGPSPEERLVLVLGVMRSGSSLLSNLLISHPEISGIGESLVEWRGPESVRLLRYWILRFRGRRVGRGPILFDKVLHGELLRDLGVFAGGPRISPIFILRDPSTAARSLLAHMRRGDPAIDLPVVWDYMAFRFDELRALLATAPPETPCAWVEYERLVAQPEAALAGLTEFLGLSTPLRAEYEVPSFVGRWGIGDGGPAIRSGRVLRSAEETPGLEVPETAASAYARLREALIAHGARRI